MKERETFQLIGCFLSPNTAAWQHHDVREVLCNQAPTKERNLLFRSLPLLFCPFQPPISVVPSLWLSSTPSGDSFPWYEWVPCTSMCRHLQCSAESQWGKFRAGSECLRLYTPIKAQPADKTQLSLTGSCWILAEGERGNLTQWTRILIWRFDYLCLLTKRGSAVRNGGVTQQKTSRDAKANLLSPVLCFS